jgi:hypothetical protein
MSSRVLSLLNRPGLYPQLEVSSLQAKQLDEALSQFARRLCGSPFSDKRAAGLRHLLVFIRVGFAGDPDWHSLYCAYKEAPGGQRHDEAQADLCESVRAFSQNYHAGTIEFAEAAKRILTRQQVAAIP